jgi:hypothetical protein
MPSVTGLTRPRRTESIVIAAILIVAAAGAFVVAARTGQLTWDEVVYASQARSLVSDVPSVYWAPYRPPGLPLLGTLAAVGGFSDISLRAITLVLGFLALAITWAVARQLWGAWAALFALLAAIGSPAVLVELRQFHNDLISSGLLILLMGLLWDQFERRREPTRLLLAAAPIAAAAFYLRYGAVPAIVAIGIVAVLLWAPSIRRSLGLVVATALLGALLLVPHLLEAIRVTGSPTGMLTGGVDVASNADPILTLKRYALWLPTAIAGPVGLVVLVIGGAHAIVTGVDAWRRRQLAPVRRHVWMLLTAVLAGLLTAIVSHPNPRYVIFPLLLGLIAGGGALATVIRAMVRSGHPRFARWSSGPDALRLVALVLALSAGFVLTREVVTFVRREPPADRSVAAEAIGADAAGRCWVITTSPPTLGWYSGCAAGTLHRGRPVLTGGGQDAGTVYVVFIPGDENRADPALVDEFRDLVTSDDWTRIDSGSSHIEVYRRRS